MKRVFNIIYVITIIALIASLAVRDNNPDFNELDRLYELSDALESDDLLTNYSGYWSDECGIGNLFENDIAPKDKVIEALKDKGYTDDEIEDMIDTWSYIAEDECIRHEICYLEQCTPTGTQNLLVMFLEITVAILTVIKLLMYK